MEVLDAILNPPKKNKDFKERLIELIKDDKELHDATVRLINTLAEQTEIANSDRKKRLEDKKHEQTDINR